MPTSLDVRTTAWEVLCCLDIGFRHMMPPWLGTIVTWLLLGTASGEFVILFSSNDSLLTDLRFQKRFQRF